MPFMAKHKRVNAPVTDIHIPNPHAEGKIGASKVAGPRDNPSAGHTCSLPGSSNQAGGGND